MQFLPNDILRLIFSFLSTKDKINILKTSFTFTRNISPISILIPKINKYMDTILSIHIKPTIEMIFIIDNFYIPYSMLNLSTFNGLHPLYCRNSMKNTCIVEGCREKKIGYIFFPLFYTSHGLAHYIKRKIPYCFKCFKIYHLL